MFAYHLSTNAGNPAKNQIVSRCHGWSVFESYQTLVAAIEQDSGARYVTPAWNISNTTTGYVAQFLGLAGVRDIREALEAGKLRKLSQEDLRAEIK